MATAPMTTRLPEWLDRELRELFRERGLGPSEGLRRIAEEWWTAERFPAIEFREGPAGRRAAVRDGPEVWEVVSVWREYGNDAKRLRAHFGWLDPRKLDQALEYYRRFRAPVDALIEENERLMRMLERNST